MSSRKEVEKLVGWLKKKGQARVHVEVTAHPDDERFHTNPPACTVTLEARREGGAGEALSAESKDLDSNTAPEDCEFTIKVEEIQSTTKRIFATLTFWKDEPPPRIIVNLTATPRGDWKDYYHVLNEPLETIEAGSLRQIKIQLIPKHKSDVGSQSKKRFDPKPSSKTS